MISRLRQKVRHLTRKGEADKIKFMIDWLRTGSIGAILLGLLNPGVSGWLAWMAFGIGIPFGGIGYWLAGELCRAQIEKGQES